MVLNNKKFAPAVQPALPLPVEAGKPGGEVIDEAPKSPSQVAASDPVSSGSSSASMSLDFSQGVPDQEMQEQVEDAPEASQTMQHGDQGDASMPSVPDPVQLSENPKPAKQPLSIRRPAANTRLHPNANRIAPLPDYVVQSGPRPSMLTDEEIGWVD